MKNEIEKTLSDISYYFLLASGPTYFFHCLRKLPSINKVAGAFTAKTIFEEFTAVRDKLKRGLYFYFCLVALSLKTQEEAEKYILKLKEESFRWSDDLIRIIQGNYRASSIWTFSSEQKPTAHQPVHKHKKETQATSLNIKKHHYPSFSMGQQQNCISQSGIARINFEGNNK